MFECVEKMYVKTRVAGPLLSSRSNCLAQFTRCCNERQGECSDCSCAPSSVPSLPMISDMPSFRSSVSQGWRCDEPGEMLTESAKLKKNQESIHEGNREADRSYGDRFSLRRCILNIPDPEHVAGGETEVEITDLDSGNVPGRYT